MQVIPNAAAQYPISIRSSPSFHVSLPRLPRWRASCGRLDVDRRLRECPQPAREAGRQRHVLRLQPVGPHTVFTGLRLEFHQDGTAAALAERCPEFFADRVAGQVRRGSARVGAPGNRTIRT